MRLLVARTARLRKAGKRKRRRDEALMCSPCGLSSSRVFSFAAMSTGSSRCAGPARLSAKKGDGMTSRRLYSDGPGPGLLPSRSGAIWLGRNMCRAGAHSRPGKLHLVHRLERSDPAGAGSGNEAGWIGRWAVQTLEAPRLLIARRGQPGGVDGDGCGRRDKRRALSGNRDAGQIGVHAASAGR